MYILCSFLENNIYLKQLIIQVHFCNNEIDLETQGYGAEEEVGMILGKLVELGLSVRVESVSCQS